MRKQLLNYIILFFISISMNSQTIMNKDSLLHLLKTKKDTALVHLYIIIGQQYENNKVDSAKYYYLSARNLSRKIGYKIGELKYISNNSAILNTEGKNQESLKLNNEALQIALRIRDPKYIATAYANVGSAYQYLDKLDLAIQNYINAGKYFNKINYPNIATLYSNIGILYDDLSQYEKAIHYHDKAIENARKVNSKYNLAIALSNKSNSLIEIFKYDETEKVLVEALKISKEINATNVYATCLLNMSDLKMRRNHFNELKKYADEALILNKQLNNIEGILISEKGLGIYYYHQKKYDEAKKHTLVSLKIAKEYESLTHQQKAYNLLSDIEVAKQDLMLANKYKMTADSIETAINLQEVQSKIEEVKGKYEAEKKEFQIKTLTQQNELQNLKIKRRFWTTITLLLALLGLSGFAYSQFRNFKTKKALLLAQQDNALAEERLRIASDMHDDVGSGLSRIRYIVGAIINGQTEQKLGLAKVTEISDDAVQKMKEIIWSLNESNQNLEDLIYYIRGQMSEMVENANVNFICHLPENIPSVFFGWKRNRNTYLLVKEAVNNALKHAEAKTITLDFIISDDLHITIKDDGKGFDTSKNFTGNGLNNYKKRIADLNATYQLKSDIDKGTFFSFQLPIGTL